MDPSDLVDLAPLNRDSSRRAPIFRVEGLGFIGFQRSHSDNPGQASGL